MANKRTDDLQENAQSAIALPTVTELFGNMAAFPVFRDIAIVCERSAHERTFAWPLRFPLPPAPPKPPDFAGLAGMYANHLAAVLGIDAHTSALRENAARSRHATMQLAFLLHAAHVFRRHLPGDVALEDYLGKVASLLLSGMRMSRPNEEDMWLTVGRDALAIVKIDGGDQSADSGRCIEQLTHFFLELPAAECRAQDDLLHTNYQRGQRLFEVFCEFIASRE